MNSSLLVPGLVVVAITAGVFVFGESLFPGGSSVEVSKKVASQSPKVKKPVSAADRVAAPTSAGSDFSWDDETTDQSAIGSSKQSPVESFVSTKQSEEAPGELFGSEFDNQSDDSFGADDDFASTDLSPSDISAADVSDDFDSALDEVTASNQVGDDLGGFFNSAPAATDSSISPKQSSDSKTAQKQSVTAANTVNASDLDVALASPKSTGQSLNAFDDFDAKVSDFDTTPRTKVNDEMPSVVMPQPQKVEPKKSEVTTAGADRGGVISGALEPVKDKSKGELSAKTPVRKFKITNPKENGLAVTLSVDGKQVSLKPDQSFVLQQSNGDVQVIFSRGGSFGFETKTLKNGHYRFTVSREAGWKLLN